MERILGFTESGIQPEKPRTKEMLAVTNQVVSFFTSRCEASYFLLEVQSHFFTMTFCMAGIISHSSLEAWNYRCARKVSKLGVLP